MQRRRFAVIDTETTGLDPAVDAVLSVAVVPVDDGVVRADLAREVLVDPGRPVPAAATAVNGITDADVAGAASLPEALADLAPLLDGRVVVGHNVGFDLAFLPGLAPGEVLDTLAISRLRWPGRGRRHTLDHVGQRLGVVPGDRHTALGDAIATAEVLVALLPDLAARGWDTPAAVDTAYRAQRRRRARLRRSIRRRSIPRPRARLSRPHRSGPRPR